MEPCVIVLKNTSINNFVYFYSSCCQPTKFGVQVMQFRCADGQRLRVPLKFAMECMCRPCQDASPDVDDTPQLLEDRSEFNFHS